MSNEKLTILTKYFNFSKKYMPLVALFVLLVCSLLKVAFQWTLIGYFVFLLIHTIVLASIKVAIQKDALKDLQQAVIEQDNKQA